MKITGEMRGNKVHKEKIKSTTIKCNGTGVNIILHHNDSPVTVFYKNGAKPWDSVLINNAFDSSSIPPNSDIYLLSTMNAYEKIVYTIEF